MHPSDPQLNTERATPPSPWGARALIVGGLTTAALVVGACGGADDSSPIILNTEKVEYAIERSSLNQRDKNVDVSCPAGVHQKKGLVFSCAAVLSSGSRADRGSTRFVVTQLDDKGRVHYEAP
jgi:hypothetical protein